MGILRTHLPTPDEPGQWRSGLVNSLTVARQRGIFTRFPDPGEPGSRDPRRNCQVSASSYVD